MKFMFSLCASFEVMNVLYNATVCLISRSALPVKKYTISTETRIIIVLKKTSSKLEI